MVKSSAWLTAVVFCIAACSSTPTATSASETAQLQSLANAQKDADVRAALQKFLHEANADEQHQLLTGKRDLEVVKTTTQIHCIHIHCHIHVVCHHSRWSDVNDCSIDDSGCQDFDPGSCTP